MFPSQRARAQLDGTAASGAEANERRAVTPVAPPTTLPSAGFLQRAEAAGPREFLSSLLVGSLSGQLVKEERTPCVVQFYSLGSVLDLN